VRAPYLVVVAGALVGYGGACNKRSDPVADSGARPVGTASTPALGAQRPGMAWIPTGILKAGSSPHRAPRVAEEEMPSVDVELHGFYIDLMPFPNEPGAIPSSNVTREEAQKLCDAKGKRLCTELEWERACKGPDNTTYEYGEAYRASSCGTGVSIEQASKRPTGERSACKSGFGVLELHGGVWEWTSSSWGRGSKNPELGVLRGGNSEAGELVGRCANALARAASSKGPTMGFRCCSGESNQARVELALTTGPVLAGATEEVADHLAKIGAGAIEPGLAANLVRVERKWAWRPVANEKLLVGVVCATKSGVRHCALVVSREDGPPEPLARFDAGREVPEVAPLGEKKLRARALDAQGSYQRELTYSFGRVEVGEAKRP
jgi:formylglycine-generating enzyme required for sulfatase activity